MRRRHAQSRVLLMLVLWLGVAGHSVAVQESNGPNEEFAAYLSSDTVDLHDMPAQALFGRQQRAFSSGCIRVQGITELAQLLFDDTDTAADVNALIATGDTRNINLRRTMPVILHYWTIHPGEDGELVFRPDIYQKDARLQKALDQPLESQGWFEFNHWTPDEFESGPPADVPVPMAGQ